MPEEVADREDGSVSRIVPGRECCSNGVYAEVRSRLPAPMNASTGVFYVRRQLQLAKSLQHYYYDT